MPVLPPLLPQPSEVAPIGSGTTLKVPVGVAGQGELAVARVGRALDRAGLVWFRTDPKKAQIVLNYQPHRETQGKQWYELDVDGSGARIAASDQAGLFYGACTLGQLIDGDTLPGVAIRDRPSFAKRGVMLDVSRGRVPTMETLYGLVDLLSSLKLNQLQLYTEHTFAYKGHEEVWEGADPMTPAEVKALDAYCRDRFIELVPNQQSFGHMHRWLKHARYTRLAELREGLEHPFSLEREPFSLCPGDEDVLAFLEGLYDQLLPNFTSGDFNVGCDETIDLGQGRSTSACRVRGIGHVYLDHLLDIHKRVAARGKRMQFWADIIVKHPDLVSQLPQDCVALLWGYEAGHDFERETHLVAESGVPFFVCPGTSSWQSIGGRVDNMLTNVKSAVEHGLARGAEGVLVTDWGDRGHLQPLPVSFPGWAVAADLSWNAEFPERLDREALAALLDRYLLRDRTGGSGSALLDLGSVDAEGDGRVANGTVPFFLLMRDQRATPPDDAARKRMLEQLDRAEDGIEAGGLKTAAGLLLKEEIKWACDVLRYAIRPKGRNFESLLSEHRRLWRARSRPGGLDESCQWLERARGLIEPGMDRLPEA